MRTPFALACPVVLAACGGRPARAESLAPGYMVPVVDLVGRPDRRVVVVDRDPGQLPDAEA
jgi:hypothetical protein